PQGSQLETIWSKHLGATAPKKTVKSSPVASRDLPDGIYLSVPPPAAHHSYLPHVISASSEFLRNAPDKRTL
ncbi:hypothetical protein HHI36_009921, partial [Cryptolaemus montrouzieri]